ncbi:MAG: hypothetical protein LIP01_00875 [Tannerellaceae bacterium]|nr:hypothetical protein [Tannerellaceae bacterium]
MNVSCSDNEKLQSGDDTGNVKEEEVEFILAASPWPYSTRTIPGSISERTVRELDILVVKDGLYQYRREAVPATDSYRTTLMVDEGLTLYFIVNSRALLESCTELVKDNRWEEDIRPALIMADPEGLVGPDVLPMWAVKENVTIVEGEINQLEDIHLLRSVASVDVYNLVEDASVFTLREAYLYFVPDKGYLAPSDTNYDADEQDVLAPQSPADMQNYATPVMTDNVLNEAILYQLYLYENDAVSGQKGTKRYSRVVNRGGVMIRDPLPIIR